MTEPTVNIPLLRKAVEWAEAEAAKPWELCEWYQGWFKTPASEVSEGAWVDDRYVTNAQVKAPSCGTCFCIAGWITEQTLPSELTLHKDGFLLLDPNGLTVTDAEEFASKQLGLDAGRHPLFNGGNTIEDVRRIAESIAGEAL